MTTRRDFLRSAALASAASVALPATAQGAPAPVLTLEPARRKLPARPLGSDAQVAQDEAYWREVAAQYAVTDRTTNMEAGYFGMMAAPVLAAYHQNVDQVNRESSYFVRRTFPGVSEDARSRVAAALGVEPGELAFARNATEALQTALKWRWSLGASFFSRARIAACTSSRYSSFEPFPTDRRTIALRFLASSGGSGNGETASRVTSRSSSMALPSFTTRARRSDPS